MAHFSYILAWHLHIDADPDPGPDPAYHFDADADPDPAYHAIAHADQDSDPTSIRCGSGSTILILTLLSEFQYQICYGI
jgi:hypothetical protein